MTNEYSSSLKNNTWNLFHLFKEHKLVHGFLQVKGIDHSKTFSPFAKSVFLHEDFHEEIYMEKYYGFV